MLVAVRVRPISAGEKSEGQRECVTVTGNSLVTVTKNSAAGGNGHLQSQRGSVNEYAFDHAFSPDSCQRDIYEKTTKKLIKEVVGGFKATVFAYGRYNVPAGSVRIPLANAVAVSLQHGRGQDAHDDGQRAHGRGQWRGKRRPDRHHPSGAR
jgi:hypothetical protein